MTTLDTIAILIFLACWLVIEPLMRRLPSLSGLVSDMRTVRRGWMREVLTRDKNNFIGDAAIIGHVIHSASFLASANLLIIIGISGTLYLEPAAALQGSLVGLVAPPSPTWLIQIKLVLMLVTLLRGLSSFVWSVRQLNFCLAAIGASPSRDEERDLEGWTEALSMLLNPALQKFGTGIRNYYFTFAVAMWVFGPLAFIAATAFAVFMLLWRQKFSESAKGVKAVKALLDAPRNVSGKDLAADKETLGDDWRT